MQKQMKWFLVALLVIAVAAAIYGIFYNAFPAIELNITKNTTVTTSIPSGQFASMPSLADVLRLLGIK
jgi:hypothetical protein